MTKRKEANFRPKLLREVQINNAQDWRHSVLGKKLSLTNMTQSLKSVWGWSPVPPVDMVGNELEKFTLRKCSNIRWSQTVILRFQEGGGSQPFGDITKNMNSCRGVFREGLLKKSLIGLFERFTG